LRSKPHLCLVNHKRAPDRFGCNRFAMIVLFGVLASLLLPNPLFASKIPGLTEDVEAGLSYLLNLAQADNHTGDLDIRAIDPVIEFIRSATEMANFTPRERAEARGTFAAYTLERPLREVLRYAYNSRIPEGVVHASSIHYSQWMDGLKIPEIWNLLDELKSPEMVRGVSRETISPDIHTGAYYAYDLQRTLVLCRNETSRIVISLSAQIGSSEVGRKGLIVGNHEDWNYLYTEDQGLNKTGLGWVKSKIYQFLSISIFIEEERRPDAVKVGVFQWLGAGWAGFNMVDSHHIRTGLERHALQFKSMLESEHMPDPVTLESVSHALWQSDEQLLREKAIDVTRHIQDKVHSQGSSRDRQVINGLNPRTYVEAMSKDEMVTLLMREFLKFRLGKETPLDAAFWVAIKSDATVHKPPAAGAATHEKT
jgi:hypothetical protein